MRQLTIERAAVVILFALIFVLATRIPVDTDMWWHLRSGQYTLTNGMIHADPFSFTKLGEPWINHSWGAQIVMYGLWQAAGNLGLALYVSVLATGGMWFVYRMSSGNVYLKAFAIVLGTATAAVFWSPRPQMLSFFLSTVVLYLLYLHKREKVDRLWLIPPIMCLWGNLHAGFSIGFIFLGGSIAGEVLGHVFNPNGEKVVPWAGIRKLVLVTVASVVALVINPYGLQMLAVPFQTVSIGALQNFIQEWNTPNFHEQQTWPFIFLLLGLLGVLGASKKRLDWTDFVLMAGTTFMALLAGRNISVFAVVATPIFTHYLDDVLRERGWVVRPVKRATPMMARLNTILVVLFVFVAAGKLLLIVDRKSVDEAQRAILPVAVAEHIKRANLTGNMFNAYNWGGYFIYELPEKPVFVDGRTDLYGDTFLTDDYYNTAIGAVGWEDTLDKYQISFVAVEAQSGLAGNLRTTPGWTLDYEDEQAVVFVRDGVGND